MGWGGSFRGSKNQKSWKCHELPRKSIIFLNPGGGGVKVLGVNILLTAEKIDNFFNPPVGGARAKRGNQLVFIYSERSESLV